MRALGAFLAGRGPARSNPRPPPPAWRMTRDAWQAALEEDGRVRHAGGVYEPLGPPDPPRGARRPGVDFAEPDLQDTHGARGVSAETVLLDYGDGRADLDVYPAWVPFDELPRPRLAGREEAREAHDDCRARQRALGYPDPGEEGHEDCDEEYPPDADGYDWESLGMARETPPAKLLVETDGRVSILDGNHRLELWGERGLGVAGAWVLDARGHRGEVARALARGERVPPRVLADYPDLAALARGAGGR